MQCPMCVWSPVYNEAFNANTACECSFWACLQVRRKCYSLIESDGNILNTSLWGQRQLGSQHAEGAKGQRGHPCLLGGGAWERPCNKLHSSPQRRWVTVTVFVFAPWPTISPPPRAFKIRAWICTFPAILDSPSALASVLSPSSPPFPLAHCELQRTKGLVLMQTVDCLWKV